MGRFGEKTREARLRWYGHVLRKDDGYIGKRVLRMELPGKRKRGRPKRRFMDVVKEDMAEVEVTEEDAEDRSNWRWKIRCGDPWWEKAERRMLRPSPNHGTQQLPNDEMNDDGKGYCALAGRRRTSSLSP